MSVLLPEAPLAPVEPAKKVVTIATAWLDGCSGCHMSFLDIDERIIDLAPFIRLVYSPLVDNKVFPDWVDVTIIEGAIASDDDLAKVKKIRAHTGLLVSLGDCAITTNVPGMRNPLGLDAIAEAVYGSVEALPRTGLPRLLNTVMPVHQAVTVDLFVPGCPPPADAIHHVLAELVAGRTPDLAGLTRFGA
jgi:NAD-reducing hydrogenase small subunit